MLCCWQEQGADGGRIGWRFDLARLGDSRTRRGFACLEALVGHLQEELQLAAATNEEQGR